MNRKRVGLILLALVLLLYLIDLSGDGVFFAFGPEKAS